MKRRDFLKAMMAGCCGIGLLASEGSNANAQKEATLGETAYLSTYVYVSKAVASHYNIKKPFFYVVPYFSKEPSSDEMLLKEIKDYLPENGFLHVLQNNIADPWYDAKSFIGSFAGGIAAGYGLTKATESGLSYEQNVYDAVKSGGYMLGESNKKKIKLTFFGKSLFTGLYGLIASSFFYWLLQNHEENVNKDRLLSYVNSYLQQNNKDFGVFIDISDARYVHLNLLEKAFKMNMKHFATPQEFYDALRKITR